MEDKLKDILAEYIKKTYTDSEEIAIFVLHKWWLMKVCDKQGDKLAIGIFGPHNPEGSGCKWSVESYYIEDVIDGLVVGAKHIENIEPFDTPWDVLERILFKLGFPMISEEFYKQETDEALREPLATGERFPIDYIPGGSYRIMETRGMPLVPRCRAAGKEDAKWVVDGD